MTARPANAGVGFIGGGRIVRILLGGWHRAGRLPDQVVVYEPQAGALDRLRGEHPTVQAGDLASAAKQPVLFLAVPPPLLTEVAASLAGVVDDETVVVSLAPGTRLARLREALDGHQRLARVIPNAASLIGAGYNPVAFDPHLPQADRAVVLDLLVPLGAAPVVTDEQLEGFCVVTAMGPTYLWPQLTALAEVARNAGLDDTQAVQAVTAMATGAARLLAEAGLPVAEVLDLVPAKPMAQPVATIAATYPQVLLPLHATLAGRS